MGNPNGAGRVFKSALETYALTKSVLASSSDIDPVATGLVKTAMEEPAIEISIDGDGEALLNIEIARDEPEDHGCSVEIRLVDLWRQQIEIMIKFWAPTLERLRPQGAREWQCQILGANAGTIGFRSEQLRRLIPRRIINHRPPLAIYACGRRLVALDIGRDICRVGREQ